MRRPTTLASLLLVAAATAALTLPSTSRADTFCVHAPSCAGGQVKPDLQAALNAAQATFGADTVLLGDASAPQPGPFVYPTGKIEVSNTVAIKGVGPGRPLLTAAAGATVLTLGNGSLEGVDVRLPSASAGTGIQAGGAQLRDVRVSGPGATDGATGIDALGNVALTGVSVTGTGTNGVHARDLALDATDLTTGDVNVGVEIADDAVVHIAGSRLGALDEAVSTRGNTFVTRSLLRSRGDGVSATGGGLTLDHDTVAGANAALNFHLVDIDGRANLSALALTGAARGIVRDTSETGGTYPIAIRDSVWDASHDLGGPFDESGDAHVAPALTAGLRPRGSSAQIDRDSKTDARYTDLDGVKTVGARADAGAFEYQRRAPSIDAAGVPGSGAAGGALQFGAVASDPDGDALQLAWTFGDGAFGAGAQTAHAYAAPGLYTATLLVTDEAGLTATRAFTVAIAGAPAAPAPPVVTPPAPAPDRVAPKLSGLKLAAGRLRFSLSEPATIRIAVKHRAAIVRKLGAGRHTLKLRAKQVTITATDAAGNRTVLRR